MKLTKQRKAYVGVLGLGLAALVVDRGFLSNSVTSPPSAVASAAGTGPASNADQKSTDLSRNGPTVTERLDALRDQAAPATSPDAFATVQSWYESAAKPGDLTTEKTVSSEYRLSGVLTDKEGKPLFAIINGQKIAMSEEVKGIRLIDAGGAKGTTPGRATIEVNGEQIELRMKEAVTRGETRVQPRK